MARGRKRVQQQIAGEMTWVADRNPAVTCKHCGCKTSIYECESGHTIHETQTRGKLGVTIYFCPDCGEEILVDSYWLEEADV